MMKIIKYCFIFIYIPTFYSQSLNCLYTFNSEISKNNGFIIFSITNDSKKNQSVPKGFNPYYATIYDIEIYNEQTKSYGKLNYESSDFNCNKNCFGKLVRLKPKKTVKYEIDMRNQFPYHKKGLYRFKVNFITYPFSKCIDYDVDKLFYYRIDDEQ